MIHRYHPFTITLRSPAIFDLTGGEPNSAETLPYVPGGALRGAVARALGDPGQDRERLAEFRDLVLGGRVRFLNAYPADGERRSLPVPASFRVDKSRPDGPVTDLAAWTEPAAAGPAQSFDTPRFTHVSLTAAQPRFVQATIRSRIHQQRDRSRGRAWTQKGGGQEVPHGAVFAYEYLDGGQAFAGVLQVSGTAEDECASHAGRVRELLAGTVLLGRSRRSGYGGEASLSWGQPREREVVGEDVLGSDVPAGTLFRALFTSPCIVRDPLTGQLDPDGLASVLVAGLDGQVDVVRRMWTFTLAGGFNSKWRLEIPQARAVAAGSVVVLRARTSVPLADILRVEHEGLGERLAEGFGRVCFLEQASRQVRVQLPQAAPVQRPPGDAPEIVRFVERRLLLTAVDRAIEARAAALASGARKVPTASLLGRLRLPLRGDPERARATLRAWCGEGDGALRRPAWDQLDRCRLGANGRARTLRGFIQHLAGGGPAWRGLEDILPLEALAEGRHVVSKAHAIDTLQSRQDVIALRLFDALLAALSRIRRRKQGS